MRIHFSHRFEYDDEEVTPDCLHSCSCIIRSQKALYSVFWIDPDPLTLLEQVFFAFTYPYGYEKCQEMLAQLDKRYSAHRSIYYKRELLTRSLEQKRVDLLTITTMPESGIGADSTTELEETIEGLFPEGRPRPRSFGDKPVIFISARVHPGEVDEGDMPPLLELSKICLTSTLFVFFFLTNLIPFCFLNNRNPHPYPNHYGRSQPNGSSTASSTLRSMKMTRGAKHSGTTM